MFKYGKNTWRSELFQGGRQGTATTQDTTLPPGTDFQGSIAPYKEERLLREGWRWIHLIEGYSKACCSV